MIKFKNISKEKPYENFKNQYIAAIDAGQKNIEAMAISTFNKASNLVDSRFVNIKIVNNKKFIFFSNYNSPKAKAFESFDQISVVTFWSATNTQIRMLANIKKTSQNFNNEYFKNRSVDKNILAVSSNQSEKTSSYKMILQKYNQVKEKNELLKCPDYWGGFYFVPFYFEFWEGHKSRINKRHVYEKTEGNWNEFIVEP